MRHGPRSATRLRKIAHLRSLGLRSEGCELARGCIRGGGAKFINVIENFARCPGGGIAAISIGAQRSVVPQAHGFGHWGYGWALYRLARTFSLRDSPG